jgi:hypothetical protein
VDRFFNLSRERKMKKEKRKSTSQTIEQTHCPFMMSLNGQRNLERTETNILFTFI